MYQRFDTRRSIFFNKGMHKWLINRQGRFSARKKQNAVKRGEEILTQGDFARSNDDDDDLLFALRTHKHLRSKNSPALDLRRVSF